MSDTDLHLLQVSPLTELAFRDCPVCHMAITSADGDCVTVAIAGWSDVDFHVACACRLGDALIRVGGLVVPGSARSITH